MVHFSPNDWKLKMFFSKIEINPLKKYTKIESLVLKNIPSIHEKCISHLYRYKN